MIYPDIYFFPEYCRLYEEKDGGSFSCFHYCSDLGEVYYPYILRPIFIDGVAPMYFDIITPYGYEGPVILACRKGEEEKLMSGFSNDFSSYCKDSGIVSEFVKFHPLLDNATYCKNFFQTEWINHTVAIDLTLDDLFQKSFSSKCRNSIRLAQKNGVILDFDFSCKTIHEFYLLYTMTMQKNNASHYYYFPEDFFYNTVQCLQNHIFIINALYQNEIVSTSLIMYHDRFMHYHFSATHPEFYHLACSNLILSEAAYWGQKHGFSFFHLGGGLESLLKFKKSFSQNGVYDFWIGKRIHLQEIYHHLVKMNNEKKDVSNTNFFPLYRA